MKKCPFCKKEIEESAVYCPYCGKNVAHIEESKQKEESYFPLLLSGLGLAFVIFPYVGLALSILSFVMNFPKRKKSSIHFDAFLFSVFGIVFGAMMVIFTIISLVSQLKNGVM